MKPDWGQVALTIGIAAATALAAVGATVGLKPSGVQVREYLLAHPDVIPEAMAALDARNAATAVRANRAAIVAPVGDAWLGNPKGDVTVVEFFDYNCTFCRASLPTLTALVKSDPNVRIVFRELPVLGPASVAAARISYAAARQGKFRAFHDPLYRAGPVTQQTLAATIAAAGVDQGLAKQAEAAAEREIGDNVALARQLGMAGTPSWVIGDQVLSGLRTLEELQAAVKAARHG